MKVNHPLALVRRNCIIICSSFLCLQVVIITAASSPSSTSSSTNQNQQRESLQATLEAARYSTFPPTVFAPGGRLYGVERVAKEALLLDVDGDVEEGEDAAVIMTTCKQRKEEQIIMQFLLTNANGWLTFMAWIMERGKYCVRTQLMLM